MKTYFVTFLLSLGASLILTWVARELAKKFRIVDASFGRKIHSGSIPRLGGPAIAIAVFIPTYALFLWDNTIADAWRQSSMQALAILLGGLASVGLGLWDDIGFVRARVKLVVQILIASMTFFIGIRIENINLPFIGLLDMGDFSYFVTVIWIISFMNAINLIDGMDGLCGGVVFIASLAVFVIALINGSLLVALFAAAIAGSVLGFLVYNFNPASIFMGDSGSYFLGFILSVISIMGCQKTGVAVAVLAPMLAIGLPIMDTFLAIIRRARQGLPLSAPDRGHIHHRLLDRGYSDRRTVMILYSFSFFLALGGVLTVLGRNWETGLALLSVLILIVLIVRIAGINLFKKAEVGTAFASSKEEQIRVELIDLYARLFGTTNRDEMYRTMEDFGLKTDLLSMKLVELKDNNAVTLWEWSHPGKPGASEKLPKLTADFDVKRNGDALMVWTIVWHSESAIVSSMIKTLFSITADVLSRAFDSSQVAEGESSETAHA